MSHGYDQANPNTGHGHVFPRPDGARARCGGPTVCPICAQDKARYDELHPPRVNPKLEHIFTYHPPKDGQPERYTRLREKAKELAYLIDSLCPDSRERSLAMTNLEQVVFWANAAIARN